MNKDQVLWLIVSIIGSPIFMIESYYLEVKRIYKELGLKDKKGWFKMNNNRNTIKSTLTIEDFKRSNLLPMWAPYIRHINDGESGLDFVRTTNMTPSHAGLQRSIILPIAIPRHITTITAGVYLRNTTGTAALPLNHGWETSSMGRHSLMKLLWCTMTLFYLLIDSIIIKYLWERE